MGHRLPLSRLPQEINDKSNTSQTSCGNYGWPTQTAAGSPSEWWVMMSKQVMVRNLRRGWTCFKPVTPCLWTTPGPGALPGKKKSLQGRELPESRVPQNPKGKLFLALPEAKEVAETGLQQCVYTVQAYWWVQHFMYLLYTARMEPSRSTSSAVNQGIAKLLLLAVHQLWADWLLIWKWTNGKWPNCF